MYSKTISFWNKPFPPIEDTRENILTSLGFGFFVFLFLLIFTPLEDSIDGNYILILSGYGAVTSLVTLFTFFLAKFFLSRYISPDNWKIKHTFFVLIWNLGLIAVANYFYMIKIDPLNAEAKLWESIYSTVAIGIFPVLFFLFITERRLMKEKMKIAGKTTDFIRNRSKEREIVRNKSAEVSIMAEVQADNFSMKTDNLLFVKSDGNYSVFYCKSDSMFTKKLVRIQLKSVENQLEGFTEFKRCHRSYLVNIYKVQKVEGNARNIALYFDNEFVIPVSRTREKEIVAAIDDL